MWRYITYIGTYYFHLNHRFDENDRIIVACTNYPDLIDPALLRPGRLGIKLQMGLCTKKMIHDILTHYLKLSNIKIKYLQSVKFPIDHYSPIELIQIIQMYNVNSDASFYQLINHIASGKKDKYN